MPPSDPAHRKTLSTKQTSLIGGCLLILGALLVLFSLRQMEAKTAVLVAMGAGTIWIGTWLSTQAKAMEERSRASGSPEERKHD